MGFPQRFTNSLTAVAVALALAGCAGTPSASGASSSSTTSGSDAPVVASASAAEDARFAAMASRIWEEMQDAGEDTSRTLPSMTPEAVAERAEQQRAWLNELLAIDAEALSDAEFINWRMLTYRLQNEVDSYDFNEHYMPLNAEGGFHSNLSFMVRGTSFRSLSDYQDYVAKLSSIPRYMSEQTAWLERGMAEGYTQPAAAMAGFEDSIAAFIVQSPDDSVFFEPLAGERPHFVSAAEWKALQDEARSIIDAEVLPAYQAYFDFMVMTYLPNCRDTVGASFLPDGLAYYQNRIEHFTTLSLTPEEIHEKGLAEVARIRNEMDVVIEKTGFEGSFEEFVDFLRNDPRFYPSSAEELLKEAAYISKRMDGQLPKFFKLLPRQPYGVEPVPSEIAPKYTTGRYSGSARDDRAGFYWVNTYALDRRPLYQLEALTLHEAVPGHHLQIALARELEGVPSYRQQTYISAFGEGWGLYSEWLGLEAGFYQDPYSDFGRLSYEMWRAARLVVDTGMHAMGWSRERAMDFMASNTALSLHNVRTEIDRYITWPGQALSYKLGEMLIKQLRAEAEDALGDAFDLREFHYQVLKNGSIPLDVLETQVRDWIDSQV